MMAVQLPGQTLRCSSNALAIPYFHPRKIYLDSPKVNFWGKRRKGAVCSISSDENSSNSLVRKRKIVEHICLLKAKKDLSEEEEKDMLDYLYTSQYHMGGIVAISLGQTLDQNPENYTHAVYMRFQKKDDLTKFYENPLYLRVLKDHVTPHCQHLLYFDFESDVEDDILAIFRKGEQTH